MYKIGDKVMHRQMGACNIKQVVDMDVNEVSKRYFLLVPLLNTKSCVYVSMDEKKQNNIRPIIDLDELKSAQTMVHSSPLEWMANPKQRFLQFSKLIASFEFQDILLTLDCLTTKNAEKKLGSNDVQLLLAAQRLVFSEIAILLNIEYDMVEADPMHYLTVN